MDVLSRLKIKNFDLESKLQKCYIFQDSRSENRLVSRFKIRIFQTNFLHVLEHPQINTLAKSIDFDLG